MMRWHRLFALLGVVLVLWVATTGTGNQLADLTALIGHTPETDPEMEMIRLHYSGTPDYTVISPSDYAAPALPGDLDYPTAILKTAALGRAAAPGAPMRFVELRMARGRPSGQMLMGKTTLAFDLASGQALPPDALPLPQPTNSRLSTGAQFKYFHRFGFFDQQGAALDSLTGIVMSVLIVTGLLHYWKLYKARARLKRKDPFWRGGGWWRDLHRWTSITAGVIVIWLTLTGFIISLDNVSAAVRRMLSGPRKPVDAVAPLRDDDLAAMTRVTLGALHADRPGATIKVLRLRRYAGYGQGAVIAADGETLQLIYNTQSGARMAMWEPGYPDSGFPTGWEWHQRLKLLHRGDYFGMTGRWFMLLGGISLLYLSISGVVMYARLWARRRGNGKTSLIWK